MEGWIKIPRKAIEDLKDPVTWAFWCWCLIRAATQKKTVVVGNQNVELEPGQFVFSRRRAAEELGFGEQTVRTCLNRLTNKLTHKLTIKVTHKYSVITIVNYKTYHNPKEQTNPVTNPVTNPLSNPLDKPELSDREIAERVGKTKEYHQRVVVKYSDDFEKFWKEYPTARRYGKLASWWAWKKMNGGRPPIEIVLLALKEWKESDLWTRDGGQYVCSPEKFIREMRWESEPPQSAYFT